ncbi:vWA domain-containing protein [Mesobacterium sp. TK19101]|uniref:VWA domain-containing protein n=1 Tax=Mesobacterium hydrothermale TaxID=3111907 RepID=A0ABU6HGQ4_9RHOB|nr:vWA domain-containing protein [Mesobacterium sp. TK19101]MEC3861141.1 vWA domain-containing protein [Mesobacterium sp. TK19101]
MLRSTLFATACATALLPLPADAQSAGNSILVLDGSGSMWGQIDGNAKITIAQEVVTGLLDTLPADQALGLVAYGHRTKGDCSDIETLIAPATGNRAQIAAAVQGITPKGKTPMTDAVIAAARALRSSEEKATVILVSDGIETCNPDPCAAATALEQAGVDFTAHAIGFDVDDPAAQAQLACLAQNTGGKYLSARNADELGAALTEVTAAPPPATLQFRAVETYGAVTRPAQVVWTVTGPDGATLIEGLANDGGSVTLAPGRYTVNALRLSDEGLQTREVQITGTDTQVEISFAAALPPATLSAPAEGASGAMIAVDWTGPEGDGDYLETAQPGAKPGASLTFVRVADGSPASLRLPAQPGDYEIRYVEARTLQVLATLPVSVTEIAELLTAPATAPIGATIDVGWNGAGYDEDYIDITVPSAAPLDYLTYAYPRDANPVTIQVPVTPGAYLIRYITAQDGSVAAQVPLTVTDVAATLSAPTEAAAGSGMQVTWTGPGNPGDYLTIATPGDGALGYVTYAYTEGGSPVTIAAPGTPGAYVLRYVADGPGSRVLVEQPLTVR